MIARLLRRKLGYVEPEYCSKGNFDDWGPPYCESCGDSSSEQMREKRLPAHVRGVEKPPDQQSAYLCVFCSHKLFSGSLDDQQAVLHAIGTRHRPMDLLYGRSAIYGQYAER